MPKELEVEECPVSEEALQLDRVIAVGDCQVAFELPVQLPDPALEVLETHATVTRHQPGGLSQTGPLFPLVWVTIEHCVVGETKVLVRGTLRKNILFKTGRFVRIVRANGEGDTVATGALRHITVSREFTCCVPLEFVDPEVWAALPTDRCEITDVDVESHAFFPQTLGDGTFKRGLEVDCARIVLKVVRPQEALLPAVTVGEHREPAY